jgi:flavodoxin
MDNRGKKLVVYYSLEGNTRFIATAISEATGAALLELKPEKDVSKDSFTKYIWGGKQVVLKEKPPLKGFDLNLDAYDTIILGTPVWANSFAPALNTFLHKHPFKGKRVGVFTCFGGGSGSTYDNIKRLLPDNEFIGEIGFKDPLKNNTEEQRLQAVDWAKKL